MSADWVPFHRRLAKGPKRGLPRAIRFVLLELSLEARAAKGRLDFWPGYSTLDAVHDLIGGNRQEIAMALDAFDDDAFVVVRNDVEHSLTLPKWEEWAGPKTGAERMQETRDRNRVTKPTSQPVTPVTRPSSHPVTRVTPTGQDRTEQDRRGEDPEPPPVREEPQSQTRMKSAPPPPMPTSGERAKFEAALRASPKLCDLDVADLAGELLTMHMSTGLKVEWLLTAILDANTKSQRGELAHIRFQRVINFARKSRPKPEAAVGESKGGSAYQDFTFAPGELGPAKQKRRVTAQDATVPSLPPVRDVAAMLAGLGTGPQRGAPVLTEAEREAKRQADVAAVLAMDDGKVAATGGER